MACKMRGKKKTTRIGEGFVFFFLFLIYCEEMFHKRKEKERKVDFPYLGMRADLFYQQDIFNHSNFSWQIFLSFFDGSCVQRKVEGETSDGEVDALWRADGKRND